MKPMFVRLGLRSQEYTRGMKDAQGRIKDMKKNTDVLTRGFKQLQHMAIAAFTGWGLSVLKRQIFDVSVEFDRMVRSMNAATGSVSAGANAIGFLKDESQRLGLIFRDQIRSFQLLTAAAKGTVISYDEVKEIYLAVAEASTVMQLSQEQSKLAIFALQQMISKGVVSMEELRRQLGDQIPGAFQIAARAMGITTSELVEFVESGELLAEEFVPAFAKQLREELAGSVEDAGKSVYSNINRMKNVFYDLAIEVSETSGMMELFKYALKEVNEVLSSGEFSENLSNILLLLSDFSKMIIDLNKELKNFNNEFEILGEKIKMLPSGIPVLDKYNPMKLSSWTKAYKELRQGWEDLVWVISGSVMPETVGDDWGHWADALEEVGRKTKEIKDTWGESFDIDYGTMEDEFIVAMDELKAEQSKTLSDMIEEKKKYEKELFKIEESAIGDGFEDFLKEIEKAKSIVNKEMRSEKLEFLRNWEREIEDLNKSIKESNKDVWGDSYDIDYGYDKLSAAIEKVNAALVKLRIEAKRTSKAIIEGVEDTYDLDFGKWTDAMYLAVDEWDEIIKDSARSMHSSFSDLFFDAIVGDLKSFSDYLNSFFRSISRIISNYMAEQLVISGMGQLGFESMGGMNFKRPSVRQHGGHVNPNQAYLVGEKGPELLFMGGQSGYVESDISGGGATNVTINNYTDSQVEVQRGMKPRDILVTIANDVNGGIIGRAIERRFSLMPQTRKV